MDSSCVLAGEFVKWCSYDEFGRVGYVYRIWHFSAADIYNFGVNLSMSPAEARDRESSIPELFFFLTSCHPLPGNGKNNIDKLN